MNNTREHILLQYSKYPSMLAGDFFKYLYQSAFGCEHLVSNETAVRKAIEEEFVGCRTEEEAVVALDGDFCRVNLSVLAEGLCSTTLAKIFCLSAESRSDARQLLEEKIAVFLQLIREGSLPYDLQETQELLSAWKEKGYPACRHTQQYRELYKPSYRVVRKEYALFLPLLQYIDSLPQGERCILAVDGTSAAGKSTLGELLHTLYGCTVFHMDDFFLRPEQRTAERFAQVGANVDRERFEEEVLQPLANGQTVFYRRFDCSTQKLLSGEEIQPTPLTVVEGAYSMHPALSHYYSYRVFMDMDPALQKERIYKRNGTQWGQRFFDEWIPMERSYFEKTKITQRCDLHICVGGEGTPCLRQ